MKLTPLDLRKQQFGKAFRGFDTDEVRSFLELVARQWEEVHDEVRLADERVAAMEHKLKHYERVELALQEALEAARESARRAEATAEQRAKMIVEEAELKALRVVSDAEQERYHLRQDFVKLTHRQNEVAARLRGFLMSELEILARFQGDDPVGFIKLFPAGRPGELAQGQQRALGEGAAAAGDEASGQAQDAASDAPSAEAPAAVHVHDVPLAEPEPSLQTPAMAPAAPAPPEEAPEPLAAPAAHEPAPGWIEDELAPDIVEDDLGPAAETAPALAAPPEAPATQAFENGVPPLAPPPVDRPLHQLLADRLRGHTSEPSVWERYTAVPDDAPAPAAGPDDAYFGSDGPAPTSDAAHGWSLRSLVTGEPEPESPAKVPADEREKIRRLLEDLD